MKSNKALNCWVITSLVVGIFALDFLLVPSTAASQTSKSLMDQVLDRKELRVGVMLEYPPITYRDADGNPKGFEVELAKLMCTGLQVKCTFVDMEFPALISALQAGKVDFILGQIAILPERAKVVDFCKPFEAAGNVVSVSPKSPLAETATTQEVIDYFNNKDRKVAVRFATGGAQVRAISLPLSQPVEVNSVLEAFLQIVSNRADAAITDDVSANKYAVEHPGSLKILLDGVHQPHLREFPAGGGVLRGNGEFCRWVDVLVQDWINSGQYQSVYIKEVGWAAPMQQLQLLRGGY